MAESSTALSGDDLLFAYLRTQFSDFEGAKRFVWRFVNAMDQEVPGIGGMSVRAMCAYCSAVLEGVPVLDFGGVTNYLATRYGSELFSAAHGGPPDGEAKH